MIKVENENVEVRGISLDIIGEFQILCDHLHKELGEKDFAFVLGTIAGKFYKKRTAEIEAECQEHQEAMRVADKTIKLLAKALELACVNHPAVCDEANDCTKGVDCVGCLVEHYKAQARKELKNEEC